jgi:hypothetical protein
MAQYCKKLKSIGFVAIIFLLMFQTVGSFLYEYILVFCVVLSRVYLHHIRLLQFDQSSVAQVL